MQAIRQPLAMLGAWLACVGFLLSAGCESTGDTRYSQRPEQDRSRVVSRTDMSTRTDMTSRSQQRAMTAQRGTAVAAFPTGDERTSVLRLKKQMPPEVRAGEPFIYTIEVTNLTDGALEGVVVYDQLPGNVELAVQSGAQQAEPGQALAARDQSQFIIHRLDEQAAADWGVYAYQGPAMRGMREEPMEGPAAGIGSEWRVGSLLPGETKTLRVQANTGETGQLQSCTTVSYQPTLCLASDIVKPELRVERIVPQEVVLCDPIDVTYRVTNIGTGTAENVVISEQLAEGVRAAQAGQQPQFTIASIPAGETREVRFQARVAQPGTYVGRVALRTPYGQTLESEESSTEVRAPVLRVDISAPENAYTDTALTYRIRVSNQGDYPARDLRLTQTLPAGAQVMSSSVQGQMRGNTLTWSLEPLAPGQSRDLTLTVRTGQEGLSTSQITAEAYCAAAAQATAQVNFAGISSLLLEVIDTNDPVQIGSNEVYDIAVINQGSHPDHNVQIVATLPEGMTFVQASGDVRFQQQGNQVTFTIPELGAKQRMNMRVIGKAEQPGDVRFQVEMNSDNLTAPVNETEATRLF